MRTVLNCKGACPVASLATVAASGAAALVLGAAIAAARTPASGSTARGEPGRSPPSPAAACQGEVVVGRTAYLMGTLLRVEVSGRDRACGLEVTESVLAEVKRLEGVLSEWLPGSEVSRLNAAPAGTATPVGRELWSLLHEARSYVSATGGAFDPGIGGLVRSWGLRGQGRIPAPGELGQVLANSGLERLRLDDESRSARRPDALWKLDTGGFGKGAALRAAGVVLRSHGVTSALLDFGGQLLVLGEPREVAVAHPAARQEAMTRRLRVGGASVSTTSSSERFVTVAGARLGHVLDPRSGWPVSAWGSVTVVAADALAADALSTALFVLGADSALAWAASHPEYGVLVQQLVGDGVRLRCSDGLTRFIHPDDCGELGI